MSNLINVVAVPHSIPRTVVIGRGFNPALVAGTPGRANSAVATANPEHSPSPGQSGIITQTIHPTNGFLHIVVFFTILVTGRIIRVTFDHDSATGETNNVVGFGGFDHSALTVAVQHILAGRPGNGVASSHGHLLGFHVATVTRLDDVTIANPNVFATSGVN